jgi:A/G-specific adenine glycosylase
VKSVESVDVFRFNANRVVHPLAKDLPLPGTRSLQKDPSASPCDISPARRRWLGRHLLTWFAASARPMPWRLDRDPYGIWVSEVMLQQTTVAAVIPFYPPFLEAFPTVADLAAASEQDVLRLWQGLGYYRRARHLHQAARELVASHGSCVPNDPRLFRELPGVGRYILGAVLSQAFDRRLPILEANTLRLLSRFFGRRDDPRTAAGQRWLWDAAERMLPARQVGQFNQAMMELGALICTPLAPRCSACPLALHCQARRLGLQAQIPPRSAPAPATLVEEAAVVARRGRKVLLVQRPPEGRWAGLWEFPHGPLEPGESHEAAAGRLLVSLTGVRASVGAELLTLRHTITRYRITLVCFEARFDSGQFASSFYTQAAWVRPAQLGSFPVSSPQRRLARALMADTQRRLF